MVELSQYVLNEESRVANTLEMGYEERIEDGS